MLYAKSSKRRYYTLIWDALGWFVRLRKWPNKSLFTAYKNNNKSSRKQGGNYKL